MVSGIPTILIENPTMPLAIPTILIENQRSLWFHGFLGRDLCRLGVEAPVIVELKVGALGNDLEVVFGAVEGGAGDKVLRGGVAEGGSRCGGGGGWGFSIFDFRLRKGCWSFDLPFCERINRH